MRPAPLIGGAALVPEARRLLAASGARLEPLEVGPDGAAEAVRRARGGLLLDPALAPRLCADLELAARIVVREERAEASPVGSAEPLAFAHAAFQWAVMNARSRIAVEGQVPFRKAALDAARDYAQLMVHEPADLVLRPDPVIGAPALLAGERLMVVEADPGSLAAAVVLFLELLNEPLAASRLGKWSKR